MTVTQERYRQGMSYDAYKAQMTRNADRFAANEQAVVLSPDDVAFFASLTPPLYTLVIAEDWCGDVIANLPILGRLAEASGTIDIRVFLRDQNLDLIDQYLKEGKFRSIPVFVFFDHNFRELGHWIERPTSWTQKLNDFRNELFQREPALKDFSPDTSPAQLPEEARNVLSQARATFRTENQAFANQAVVSEIRAIIEASLASKERSA
jgi:hypothetical protein